MVSTYYLLTGDAKSPAIQDFIKALNIPYTEIQSVEHIESKSVVFIDGYLLSHETLNDIQTSVPEDVICVPIAVSPDIVGQVLNQKIFSLFLEYRGLDSWISQLFDEDYSGIYLHHKKISGGTKNLPDVFKNTLKELCE